MNKRSTRPHLVRLAKIGREHYSRMAKFMEGRLDAELVKNFDLAGEDWANDWLSLMLEDMGYTHVYQYELEPVD